jgi:hypothetical protein
MSAVKDYAKEYIMTLKGEMPISVALLVLKYRYEDDIVAALYDYAFVHNDKYVAQQANVAYSRDHQRNTGGPVASPGNLPKAPVTTITEIPVESFADRVKAIVRKAATKNGQRIETSARGNAGAYIYNIDAEAFCKAMDEMVSSYGDGLKEMLGGTMNCVQVTKVCSFIGNVIRMHVINDVVLQTVDLLFAFEDYYDNLQTVQAKLGDRKASSEQNVVLGTFEGLLRKYKA